MVFYRKYRPQTIDELDNEDVRKTLTSVLSSPTPPHAYLFTGPKGLGKTSSARIVAKVLNCERQKSEDRRQKTENRSQKTDNKQSTSPSSEIEPCNTCDTCVSITNGTNLDVLEIDAASNRGIDEMRDLREKIRLAPVSANKKVYIIDEVHMLTTEAFNALLKTLEEPPAHAVFILATTEPQKVPATILSRCLHVSFHKATQDELLRSFGRIVKGEGISIDEKALVEIARLSDGGFRDGAKILEELAFASGGKPITLEILEKEYHSVSSSQYVQKLFDHLQKRDLQGSIAHIATVATSGLDMRFFIEQLLEHVHVLLLAQAGIGDKQEEKFTLLQIGALSDLLQKAHARMRDAVVPPLPLELAVIDYLTTSEQEPSVVSDSEVRNASGGKGAVDLHAMRKQVGELHKKRAVLDEKPEEKKDEKPTANGASLMAYSAQGALTDEWLSEFWHNFIGKVKEYNHTISGVLRGCRLKSFDRKTLIIETAYKFHKDRLSENKTQTALEQAAKTLAGNMVEVRIELRNPN